MYPNEKNTSLLFADDLFGFNLDNCLNRLLIQMRGYLKQLELWLNIWRATMAANKCSFTIYSKKMTKELDNGKFVLHLYGQPIPINHCTKYLGIIVDRHLNFHQHAEFIRNKCIKLLNILKCLENIYFYINLYVNFFITYSK